VHRSRDLGHGDADEAAHGRETANG
jgi:hypothetical protein